MLREAALNIQVESQKTELEGKRDFIRFISHEVRTPLNVALMGLAFLLTFIRKYDNDTSEDALRTLWEVNGACKSSVDILDDVLNFDKITSGSLELNRSNENAKSIVSNAVKAFNMMVSYNIQYYLKILFIIYL